MITGDFQYWGRGCEKQKCPHSNGNYYPSDSTAACEGRGACNDRTGVCTCDSHYFGNACQGEDCFRDCGIGGKDACNTNTATCSCPMEMGFSTYEATYGEACEFFGCPEDCGASENHGVCNRVNGQCLCKEGYSGAACWETTRCTQSEHGSNLDTPQTNWWTVWDKPGWVTCPKGQLLYSLKRSKCDALSCIDEGGCAAACEGVGRTAVVYYLRHCYHDLRWYNSFDRPEVPGDAHVTGWSKCLEDYFVAGLYRDGESLYNLQMAKCCSLEFQAKSGHNEMRVKAPVRQIACSEESTTAFAQTAEGADGDLTISSAQSFITGFKRGAKHTLEGFAEVSYCRFIRGY